MSLRRRLLISTLAVSAAGSLSLAGPAMAGADSTPPTGSYTVDQTSAYTNGTYAIPFNFTRTALHDDTSTNANITQEIDPGDGSGYVTWGSASTHYLAYQGAGIYHPIVRLTDEAGNSSMIELPTITLVSDLTLPAVHITKPAPSVISNVSAWVRAHGTAHDTGSGVGTLLVIVLERRSGIWYGYDYTTHQWAKGYAGLQKTLKNTAVGPTYPPLTATGTWRATAIHGLTKGTLRLEALAFDKAGNSASKVVTQVLTHS